MGASESSRQADVMTSCRAHYGGQSPSEGPVMGCYFERAQEGVLRGVITVTSFGVQTYNPVTGDRRVKFSTSAQVTSCGCLERGGQGSTLVVGTSPGHIHVLSAADLRVIRTLLATEDSASSHRESGDADEVTVLENPLNASGSKRDDRVTAVHMVDEHTLVAGDSSGIARLYSVVDGTQGATFLRRGVSQDGQVGVIGSRAVVSVVACTLQAQAQKAPPQCVAVGYRDGAVHVFHRSTAKCLRMFEGPEGLRSVHFLSQLGTLVVTSTVTDEVWLWDTEKDNSHSHILNFTSELRSLQQPPDVRSTCTHTDSTKNLLLTGMSDGKVFVRRIVKQRQDGAFHCQLLRTGCPTARQPPALSRTPTAYPVSSIGYDSQADIALIGDASGLCRAVRAAAGVNH